jgi:hypothetical protein
MTDTVRLVRRRWPRMHEAAVLAVAMLEPGRYRLASEITRAPLGQRLVLSRAPTRLDALSLTLPQPTRATCQAEPPGSRSDSANELRFYSQDAP